MEMTPAQIMEAEISATLLEHSPVSPVYTLHPPASPAYTPPVYTHHPLSPPASEYKDSIKSQIGALQLESEKSASDKYVIFSVIYISIT